ncbi:MAG TPA: hypothetical protein VF411_06840 [Bacteroidia bacterium]
MTKTSLPKSKVSKEYHSLDTTNLCEFANGINTNEPHINNPTGTPPVVPIVTSVTLRGKATALLNIHSGRQTLPPTTTANQEDVAKTDLLHNLDKLANQVDTVAQDAAIAAADASAAEAVITGVGFKVAGKSTGMKPHTFKQLKSAKNTVLVQLTSSGKGSIYSVRCGVTANEGVIPAAWEPTASIATTELLISGGGLKTGQLLAIQYGVTQHLAASTPPAQTTLVFIPKFPFIT